MEVQAVGRTAVIKAKAQAALCAVRWSGALKDEFEDLIGTKAPCITTLFFLVVSALKSLPPKLRDRRRTGLAVLRLSLSLPQPRLARKGLRWPNLI